MAGDVTHSIQVSIHWRENSNKTFTEKCVSGKKLSDHVKVMQEQVNSFLTQLVEEEKKSTTAVKRNQEDDVESDEEDDDDVEEPPVKQPKT
ncbi:hypothetical protein DPMN_088338 [Dreissena polymorpha]|uniref:EKC/KEOPS complex subunit GON7 n=1 Tax=Dreissena polymorpha TaxID=45954 RepID=A0A9D4QXS7_DREPO|nr:hypothetical protein DPMN_088338 [Dreissena polymorpha]